MDEFIKLLDKKLRYIRHELIGDSFYIYVESKPEEAICPYCKTSSTRVHSIYQRTFQRLGATPQERAEVFFLTGSEKKSKDKQQLKTEKANEVKRLKLCC